LYLSLKNGLIGLDLGRGESARRTYGCLYGITDIEGHPPIVPLSVSIFSMIENLAGAILILLFLLAVRNLLRLK
jgi:hypothetical protein